MPSCIRLVAAATLALSVLLPMRVAHADTPPPPGYVETCTVEKQKQTGLECQECSAFFGNAHHCRASLEAYGFASTCRSRGASVWTEVWCRKKDASAKPVPREVIDQLGNAQAKAPSTAPSASGTSVTDASTTAATPSAMAAPTTSATAAPTTSTTPSVSATPRPSASSSPATTSEKGGGCGACAITRDVSGGAPLLVLAGGAALLGVRRRRRAVR